MERSMVDVVLAAVSLHSATASAIGGNTSARARLPEGASNPARSICSVFRAVLFVMVFGSAFTAKTWSGAA